MVSQSPILIKRCEDDKSNENYSIYKSTNDINNRIKDTMCKDESKRKQIGDKSKGINKATNEKETKNYKEKLESREVTEKDTSNKSNEINQKDNTLKDRDESVINRVEEESTANKYDETSDKNNTPKEKNELVNNNAEEKDTNNKSKDSNEINDKFQRTQKLDQSNPSTKYGLTSINALKLDKRCLSYEFISQVRKKVNQAIYDHKIFAIRGGFSTIRKSLLDRGWLEKVVMKTSNSKFHNEVSDFEICEELFKLEPEEIAENCEKKCEKAIITKLLEYTDIDFFWNLKHDSAELLYRLDRKAIFNRFIKSPFTSKNGLCAVLNQMQWFNIPEISYTQFPRCYYITQGDQLQSFIDDFRLTACAAVLKWFVAKLTDHGEMAVACPDGQCSFSHLIFAINRLNDHVSRYRHEDIDNLNEIRIWEYEWEDFLENVELILNKSGKFIKNSENENYFNNLLALTKNTLYEFSLSWPQNDLDGDKNIWIVKPANKCRGRGIQMSNNLEEILNLSNARTKKSRFVVQKYIERPFLIYNTKFDIRQWFLVCSIQPMIIWMYQDSYLRFSSQTFDLSNFDESIHLTNNAVQRKYTNGATRDSNLPSENMWDCDTFKAYLIGCGCSHVWDDVIYPGMKQAIIGAMLASQDGMDRRSNSFELFGADFMICENFTPWLIEINSSPDMAPTTSVTARLCPQCLEDIIKIVIDQKIDPNASSGRFELIYKQSVFHSPPYLGLNLCLEGKRILRKYKRSKSIYNERRLVKKVPKSAPILKTNQQENKTVVEDISLNNQMPVEKTVKDRNILNMLQDETKQTLLIKRCKQNDNGIPTIEINNNILRNFHIKQEKPSIDKNDSNCNDKKDASYNERRYSFHDKREKCEDKKNITNFRKDTNYDKIINNDRKNFNNEERNYDSIKNEGTYDLTDNILAKKSGENGHKQNEKRTKNNDKTNFYNDKRKINYNNDKTHNQNDRKSSIYDKRYNLINLRSLKLHQYPTIATISKQIDQADVIDLNNNKIDIGSNNEGNKRSVQEIKHMKFAQWANVVKRLQSTNTNSIKTRNRYQDKQSNINIASDKTKEENFCKRFYKNPKYSYNISLDKSKKLLLLEKLKTVENSCSNRRLCEDTKECGFVKPGINVKPRLKSCPSFPRIYTISHDYL